MIDHTVPAADGGEEIEVGFLHDHMVGSLGEPEANENAPWTTLCGNGSQLGEHFVSAWDNVREAAGDPDDGPLKDGPTRAGCSFLTADAMRWPGTSAPGPEDDEDKVKEQKQITTAIEDYRFVALRDDFENMDSTDMRRAAMFAVGPSSRAWLYTPPYRGASCPAMSFR